MWKPAGDQAEEESHSCLVGGNGFRYYCLEESHHHIDHEQVRQMNNKYIQNSFKLNKNYNFRYSLPQQQCIYEAPPMIFCRFKSWLRT